MTRLVVIEGLDGAGTTTHVRTLLAILDEVGGYMPTHHQKTISAAERRWAGG